MINSSMINALFVETDGVYFNIPNIIAWDENKNAFDCKNGYPAICHPPCKRWGRYWSGGPSAKVKRFKGDDNGAFAFSIWYVRTFGGVIEHPEASHAWKWFGLSRPPKQGGGWIKADYFGGFTCCVEQGHYGHRARKATWLYLNGFKPKELIWGKSEGKIRLDEGFHSKNEAKIRRDKTFRPKKRISVKEMISTPEEFRDLLIDLVSR